MTTQQQHESEPREPQDPQVTPLPETGKVYGDRGLSIWAGFLSEEYLTDLKPWNKEVRTYLEMRDDFTISTLLDAIKMVLLKAELTVEPASNDVVDVMVAEWVDSNLREMERQTLRSFLDDALEILDFGFSLHEIVLEKRSDGRLWLRNLEPRGQETLRRWQYDDVHHPDVLTHFIQGGFRGSAPRREVAIPIDKCVHITFRGRKGSPQGKAMLRSLYPAYKFLKNFRVFEGIGVERDVGGMPVYEMPEGANGTIGSAEQEEINIMLEGIRQDEAVFAKIPHGAKLTSYSAGAKAYNVREIIRDYEKAILMRGFAQFIALGMDKVGTQALVEGQSDFFSLGLEAVQDHITEALNQQLVPYLLRYNTFPGATGLPKIVWSPPGNKNIEGLLEILTTGAAGGLVTLTRDDEVAIRDAAGLPSLPDGVGEGERNVPDLVADMFGNVGIPSMNRKKAARQIRFSNYDHPAGQDLRITGGGYELFANNYQRELVTLYDDWADETVRLTSLPSKTAAQMNSTLASRLEELRIDMKTLSRQRIAEASGMGLGEVLGKRASSPEVQRTVTRLVGNADAWIDETVIPGIRERFSQDAIKARTILELPEREAFLRSGLSARRAGVAQGSGSAIAAIFETQKAAGIAENRERRRLGLNPIAVRWVLDDRAEHCEDDPSRGTFGCPSLARVYEQGWDSMVTVPAGNVSCLLNCRCYIEADFEGNGNWRRIT